MRMTEGGWKHEKKEKVREGGREGEIRNQISINSSTVVVPGIRTIM